MFLGALLLLAAVPAATDSVPMEQGEVQNLYVQLVVNDEVRGELIEVQAEGDALWVGNATLKAAGVSINGDGRTNVASDPRFITHYNAARQRVELTVAVDMLPMRHLRSGRVAQPGLEAASGFALNYDLNVQIGDQVGHGGLWTEQRWFSAQGNASNNGAIRFGGAERARYIRYDTYFRRIDEARALQLTVGDLISGGLSWSRPYRMGGIQLGRVWRIRPDIATMPLPRFAGEAAVPSVVDLFVDGHRQQRREVEPGRFVIDALPVVSGAGNARIVTTDAIGRQVVTNIPFYVAPEMLARGLTDFGAEAGFVRRRYGYGSFDYGMAAASGYVRHGLTDRLTIEGIGEASRRSGAGGVGAIWAPGLYGSFSTTATLSAADGRGGHQWSAGYNYSGRRMAVSVEHQRASSGFRSIADLESRFMSSGGKSTRVFASANLDRLGNLGLGYLDIRPRRGDRAQIATSSWSLPLGERASALAGADYDIRRRNVSLQFRISVALGRSTASGGVRVDGQRRAVATAEFSRAVPYDGGIGVDAGIAADAGGPRYGQATVSARTRWAHASGGVAFAGKRAVGMLGVSGSAVIVDGGAHLANSAGNAFAIVSTDGVAGVPVRYENQVIGITDRRGHVFVPRVAPYHVARYAIDTVGLDADLSATDVERRVAIAEGAGALVHIPIRRMRGVTLGLVDRDGVAIAPGSVADPNGARLIVGWDGILFIENTADTVRLDVRRADGGICSVDLSLSAERRALDHLGNVPCV